MRLTLIVGLLLICTANGFAAPLVDERDGAREMGLTLKQRFPTLIQHPVHWILAVDVSGSMAGPKLNVLSLTLQHWFATVVTDSDLVTVYVFDDQVRELMTKQPASPSVVSRILMGLRPRLKRQGTNLDGARRAVIANAQDAAVSMDVITVVWSDQTYPDGIAPDPVATGVEEHLDYVVFKSASLVRFLCGVTRGRPTPSPQVARYVPLVPPRVERIEPLDPAREVRRLATFLPLLLALVGLPFLGFGALGKAGHLVVGRREIPLMRRAPIWLQVDKSGRGFTSERDGMDGRDIASAEVPLGWLRTPGCRIVPAQGYHFRDSSDLEKSCVELPFGETIKIRVFDTQSAAAEGSVEWQPNPHIATFQWLGTALLLLGFLAFLASPTVDHLIGPPPHTIDRTIDREPL